MKGQAMEEIVVVEQTLQKQRVLDSLMEQAAMLLEKLEECQREVLVDSFESRFMKVNESVSTFLNRCYVEWVLLGSQLRQQLAKY